MSLSDVVKQFSWGTCLSAGLCASSVFAQARPIPPVPDNLPDVQLSELINEKKETKKNKENKQEEVKHLNSDEVYTPKYRIELGDKTYFITSVKRENANFVIDSKGVPVGLFRKGSHELNIDGSEFYLELPDSKHSMVPILAEDPNDGGGLNDAQAPSLVGTIKTPFDVPQIMWAGKVFANEKTLSKDRTRPKFEIEKQEFLESNSVLVERIAFTVEMGELFMTYEIVDSLKTTKRLTKSVSPITTTRFTPYLKEGENKIKIVASDYAGNETVRFINIKRENIVEKLDDIEFIMPGVVHKNFKSDLPIYKSLLREIKARNLVASALNKVRKIFIVYHPMFQIHKYASPVENGWYVPKGDRIYLGYGYFKMPDAKRHVKNLFLHEFGHKIYTNLETNDRALFNEVSVIFDLESMDMYGLNWLNPFFKIFKDSTFCGLPNAGHPRDNSNELFASAFFSFREHGPELRQKIEELPAGIRGGAEYMHNLMSEVKENSDLLKLNKFTEKPDNFRYHNGEDIFQGFH